MTTVAKIHQPSCMPTTAKKEVLARALIESFLKSRRRPRVMTPNEATTAERKLPRARLRTVKCVAA
jgi:hypothetical protein